jgi:hypothetical protein
VNCDEACVLALVFALTKVGAMMWIDTHARTA